ncbi:hypothetical protein [Alicyclobacillus sp. SO9]|uniref:hypothetical protein n=1 Tax=Alicyclobacillus sp. SO9 TaxID=2665646 RepID=UPI0018E74E69|nr:hypothetical protein [Alicyclobacillus sp. SO9]QQE77682.1 hypothetical protein GI364_17335 [Alicyclobacillus sp. SO9]
MERTVTMNFEEKNLTRVQRLMHRWQTSERRHGSRQRRIRMQYQQALTDCTCVECGSEFSVQREGAQYVCDRCASDNV